MTNIQTVLPPPPPGLGPAISKPPPGFTGVQLNSNVAECTVTAFNRLAGMKCSKDKYHPYQKLTDVMKPMGLENCTCVCYHFR